MKDIKITDKEKLIELLQGALDNAGILNEDVGKKVDEIHKQLSDKKITTPLRWAIERRFTAVGRVLSSNCAARCKLESEASADIASAIP